MAPHSPETTLPNWRKFTNVEVYSIIWCAWKTGNLACFYDFVTATSVNFLNLIHILIHSHVNTTTDQFTTENVIYTITSSLQQNVTNSFVEASWFFSQKNPSQTTSKSKVILKTVWDDTLISK